MEPTSLETVSRWASVAGVVLSALAAIAITIAAYTSSRLLTATAARTAESQAESARAIASLAAQAGEADQRARAALALASELKSVEQLNETDLERTSGEKPIPTESPTAPATTVADDSRERARRSPMRDHDAIVAILKSATSPPRVELSWAAADNSYATARNVGRALEEAGWTVVPTGSLLTSSSPVATLITTGVLSNEALLLRKALETSGVKVSMVLESTMAADRITVMIGNDQSLAP